MKIKIKLIRNALALSKSKGFTLIELLVVVAIIGILATVVIINVSGAKASSRYVKTVAEMSEISKATLQYKAEHNGVWPKEWSGYSDWTHTCDPADCSGHVFKNSLDPAVPATYNDFLVNYMGGQRFKPDCANSAYSFYNMGDYQILVYWPKSGLGNVSTTYPVQGTDPSQSILDKTTKQLTCNEDTLLELAQ